MIGSASSPFSAVTLGGVAGIGIGVPLTFLKIWVITGSFSAITVRINSYPGIVPCSEFFSLPVLRDGFNTFPASSIQRTSIVTSGKVIGSASSPFSAVTLGGVAGIGIGVPLTFLKIWVITGSFSAITVRINSYPGIVPCSEFFSLPVLRDGFNTFPASSIQRTSIVTSGKVIGSASSPFSAVTLGGVVTLGTSTDGLPGSVILPVPGTLPSGKSLFGTLPLPSSPIVTVIVLSPLTGISTVVPGGYVEPSGFFGVTVRSPVLGSFSNSTVGSFVLP